MGLIVCFVTVRTLYFTVFLNHQLETFNTPNHVKFSHHTYTIIIKVKHNALLTLKNQYL